MNLRNYYYFSNNKKISPRITRSGWSENLNGVDDILGKRLPTSIFLEDIIIKLLLFGSMRFWLRGKLRPSQDKEDLHHKSWQEYHQCREIDFYHQIFHPWQIAVWQIAVGFVNNLKRKNGFWEWSGPEKTSSESRDRYRADTPRL